MKRGLSQEGLKLIACITMVIDHVGAVLIPWLPLRIIGRLTFPIFCFLISEGAVHTRHPGKYALRLGLAAILAELPFDYCFYGAIYWGRQNVMVTLLLGFGAVYATRLTANFWLKLLSAAPFVIVSMFTKADYGMEGVLLVLLFGLTREVPFRHLIQVLGMLLLFLNAKTRILFTLVGIPINLQMLCITAILPIWLYSGEKRSYSKALQYGFYLFYPVHLAILSLLK